MSTSSSLSYHNVGEFYPRKFGPKPDVVPSGVTERKVMPLDKPDMVTVDVLNVSEADVDVYTKKHDTYVMGTIHPFRKSTQIHLWQTAAGIHTGVLRQTAQLPPSTRPMETVGGPQIRFLLNDLLMQASDMDRLGSSSGDIPKPAFVNSLFITAYQQRGRGLRIKGHSRGWTGGGSSNMSGLTCQHQLLHVSHVEIKNH
ncbi:hypothetical protein fugu_012643 [Takifugu bimaculatus]|uniref:Uncharacterized protein n=1 Tax=Takifugu bimaculatus TaxID=433685 RepID=A0A4Z2C609_9TELE|nr:hypothetical protein fugu_012643 [Takifugu bimaculatus]